MYNLFMETKQTIFSFHYFCDFIAVTYFKPFLANDLILYPLKTTEDFFVCLLNIDWKWFNDY